MLSIKTANSALWFLSCTSSSSALFDYADVESVQFAIWPPATYAEAIKLNPTAISATPLQSPHMQTVNIDTPQALLDLMFLGGYSISVNGNSLEVIQAQWIDEELASLITSHKVGLIKMALCNLRLDEPIFYIQTV